MFFFSWLHFRVRSLWHHPALLSLSNALCLFCKEWHRWHRAPWVTCYMALEVNTKGAHLVLKAPSLFIWRRGCQPHESERVLLARVHLNTQYSRFKCQTARLVLASHGQKEVEKNKWVLTKWLSVNKRPNTAKDCWTFWVYKAVSVSQNALSQQLFPPKPPSLSTEALLQYRTEMCFPLLGIPIG